ncbi:MAG: hypothetical protein HYS25_13850 [Ignavibacteriales bacterium]|nr:hypothetical protein [Ignavibacteriales bacterium]
MSKMKFILIALIFATNLFAQTSSMISDFVETTSPQDSWFTVIESPIETYKITWLNFVNRIFTRDNTWSGTNRFDNKSYSPDYVSGWSGSGWNLDYDITEEYKSTLELDNLWVRGSMNVYELLIHQINAPNGNLLITSSAKVSTIDAVDSTFITLIDATGRGLCPFKKNDLLLSQAYDALGATTRLSKAKVDTVYQLSFSGVLVPVMKVSYYSTPKFRKGDVIIRVGNLTDASRQSSIYIAADDNNAPFIDIIDGVAAIADWGNTAKTKVRLGKLNGIVDADFGSLSGYGLFAQGNVYIKGAFLIDNPEDNGINTTYRQTTAPAMNLKEGDLWVDTDDFFKMYWYSGTAWVDYIPGFGSATSSGLALTGSYLGFYNGASWKTYIDNTGNFFLTSQTSSTDYLQWSNSTLSIKGALDIKAGSSGYSNLNDKPSQLSDINTAEASKLTGIQAGATVGAIWGTNLSGIPIRFADTPSGAGLFVTGSYLGFYDGGAWKAYINSVGQFYFSGNANNYIQWNGSALTVRGSLNADDITAGTITGRTLQTSSSGERVVVSNSNNISFYTTAGLAAYIGNSGGYGSFATYQPTTSEYSRLVWSGLNFYSASGYAASSIDQLNVTIRNGTTGTVKAILGGTGISFYEGGGTSSFGVGGMQLSSSAGTLNFRVDNTGNIVEWGDKAVSPTYSSGQYLRYNGTSFDWATPSGGSSYTFTAPLSESAGTVSIAQSSGTTNGYLNSTDWNLFNNKVSTSRTISTSAPLSGGGDLSANRTLSLSYGSGLELSGSTLVAKANTATGISVGASGIGINYGNGLATSGGTTLVVSANSTHFVFTGGALTLNQVPSTTITGTWGTFTVPDGYIAATSGGSPTTAVGTVNLTLGGSTYRVYVRL